MGSERWWVLAHYGVEVYADRAIARDVFRNAERRGERNRIGGSDTPALVGPAPDLPSAMNLDPEAFGLEEGQRVVALDRGQAEWLIAAVVAIDEVAKAPDADRIVRELVDAIKPIVGSLTTEKEGEGG